MKGIVDRIEDGNIAVIAIEGGGKIMIPVEQLDTGIYEGAHLDISMKLDPESEKEMKKEIMDLQRELLERTKEQQQNEDE
ncbi:DUF3006 domain-containing protein [Elusimicrobiota bacterium]